MPGFMSRLIDLLFHTDKHYRLLIDDWSLIGDPATVMVLTDSVTTTSGFDLGFEKAMASWVEVETSDQFTLFPRHDCDTVRAPTVEFGGVGWFFDGP